MVNALRPCHDVGCVSLDGRCLLQHQGIVAGDAVASVHCHAVGYRGIEGEDHRTASFRGEAVVYSRKIRAAGYGELAILDVVQIHGSQRVPVFQVTYESYAGHFHVVRAVDGRRVGHQSHREDGINDVADRKSVV